MKSVLPQINFTEVLRVMSVTYTAVLDASEDSVLFLSALLCAERLRCGTRKGTRALSTYNQAVLVLRWLLEDTRMSALAKDNAIAVSTAYAYLDEGVAVLAGASFARPRDTPSTTAGRVRRSTGHQTILERP